MKIKSTYMTLLIAVGGCSTSAIQSNVDGSSARTFSLEKVASPGLSKEQLDEENQKLLESKLEEVLNFCLPRLSGYEKTSAEQAKKAYWLSISGLVAGSILVPGLTAASASGNAPAIAALGGWAGATNFASQALKSSGLSGSTIAETRNGIIQRVKDEIATASDGTKSFEERRNALMRARSECIIYEISVPNIPQEK